MKLAKLNNADIDIIEVENGVELSGDYRTEECLYSLGYKKLCECNEDGEKEYLDYDTCIIEIVKQNDDLNINQ